MNQRQMLESSSLKAGEQSQGSGARGSSARRPGERGARGRLAGLLLRGVFCLGLAVCFSSQALGWEEVWRIDSPPDGHEFTSPLRQVDIYVTKPGGRPSWIQITYISDGGGQSNRYGIGDGYSEIFSFGGTGNQLPDGEYQIALCRDEACTDIKAVSRFTIKWDNQPINLPTLDFPIVGTEFPGGISKIRFSGFATCRVYIGLKKNLKEVFVDKADPDPNGFWFLDVPWSYGSGSFNADLFLADPRLFRQVAEDGTVFRVLEGNGSSGPETKWKSHPYPR